MRKRATTRIATCTRAHLAIAAALLSVLASSAAPLAAENTSQETKLLQVILLSASRSGPSNLADLPGNAQKAISDIRDFLPFRSYQMLDASLIRSHRNSSTVMRGVNNDAYDVEISFADLRNAENQHTGEIVVRHFEVSKRPSVPRMLLEPPRGQSSDRDDPPLSAPTPTRSLISTTFTATIGNTVVVGSSRLDGDDQALVVLFTALP